MAYIDASLAEMHCLLKVVFSRILIALRSGKVAKLLPRDNQPPPNSRSFFAGRVNDLNVPVARNQLMTLPWAFRWSGPGPGLQAVLVVEQCDDVRCRGKCCQ